MLAGAGAAAVIERIGDVGAVVDGLLDGGMSAEADDATGTDDGDAGTV